MHRLLGTKRRVRGRSWYIQYVWYGYNTGIMVIQVYVQTTNPKDDA